MAGDFAGCCPPCSLSVHCRHSIMTCCTKNACLRNIFGAFSPPAVQSRKSPFYIFSCRLAGILEARKKGSYSFPAFFFKALFLTFLTFFTLPFSPLFEDASLPLFSTFPFLLFFAFAATSPSASTTLSSSFGLAIILFFLSRLFFAFFISFFAFSIPPLPPAPSSAPIMTIARVSRREGEEVSSRGSTASVKEDSPACDASMSSSASHTLTSPRELIVARISRPPNDMMGVISFRRLAWHTTAPILVMLAISYKCATPDSSPTASIPCLSSCTHEILVSSLMSIAVEMKVDCIICADSGPNIMKCSPPFSQATRSNDGSTFLFCAQMPL
mmetsp:Transcript_44160/g.114805  ORF Transcript_44160/g.114805 Transcript_44160/m.114805 type:complete len:329 (-) Transcript_44160:586-1572(-)